MKSDDAVAGAIRGTGVLVFAASALLALYVLGRQTYSYLKTGDWFPVGVLDFIGSYIHWEWAVYPTDWTGLHTMLNQLNAGLAVFFAGLIIGALLFNFESQ